jgi:hypothetical protein
LVAQGNRVTVTAGRCVVGRHATTGRIAAVVGASVTVVADPGCASNAYTARTGIVGGAGIAIVTGHVVVGRGTSTCRVATIVGAQVTIVAVRRKATYAGPGVAAVARGTSVAVIASARNVDTETTTVQVTTVVGAGITVVAIKRRAPRTGTSAAGVGGSAGIAIIASRGIVRIGAARHGITAVIGTAVAVVTISGGTSQAYARQAGIPGAAGVVVVAATRVISISTTAGWLAGIVGTDVTVIAVPGRTRDTGPRRALVGHRTRVAIITIERVVRRHAAGGHVARIVGAEITVVAVRRRATNTDTTTACICERTGTAIIAGALVVNRHTTAATVTGVIRTAVAVVAVQPRTGHARSSTADVVLRAGVGIIAGHRVVVGHASAGRIAGVVGTTVTIITVRRRAAKTTSATAGVRRCTRVAIVASCRVVDGHATAGRIAAVVSANVAVVTDRGCASNACTARTGVVGGTGIAIVTGHAVVGSGASTCRVATIVGAQVTIVAVRREATYADPGAAAVARGTSVAVGASVGVVGKGATRHQITAPGGTGIAIVAERVIGSAAAQAGHADVAVRASHAVVARSDVKRVFAGVGHDVADIVGAGVTVVA